MYTFVYGNALVLSNFELNTNPLATWLEKTRKINDMNYYTDIESSMPITDCFLTSFFFINVPIITVN